MLLQITNTLSIYQNKIQKHERSFFIKKQKVFMHKLTLHFSHKDVFHTFSTVFFIVDSRLTNVSFHNLDSFAKIWICVSLSLPSESEVLFNADIWTDICISMQCFIVFRVADVFWDWKYSSGSDDVNDAFVLASIRVHLLMISLVPPVW